MIGTVYHSSKTAKRQSKCKNHHWCTNRHMSTKTVPTVYQSSKTVKNSQKTVQQQKMTIPLVYQSSHVYTQSTEYTKPCKRHYLAKPPSHVPGQWPQPVARGRADCMCLHGRPCVWLPFAAACCYTLFYLLMMLAARLVCQRLSSNFPYFQNLCLKTLREAVTKNNIRHLNILITVLDHECHTQVYICQTNCK